MSEKTIDLVLNKYLRDAHAMEMKRLPDASCLEGSRSREHLALSETTGVRATRRLISHRRKRWQSLRIWKKSWPR
jgi:hypothetical protein